MKFVLLKLSGELLNNASALDTESSYNTQLVSAVIAQIKQLLPTHRINIVIGGGNFFRGAYDGALLGIQRTTADTVGMLATAMNALILQDFFLKAGIPCMVMGSQKISGVVPAIDQVAIDRALKEGIVIIFCGGTGNPYFSTDTAAVLRALQVKASTIWKATTVDYLYDSNPTQNPQAQPIKKATYDIVLAQKLRVMDLTAITLAQEHDISLRIFSIFKPNALIDVATNPDFGSTVG